MQTDTWTSSGIWMPCQYKTTMSLVNITLKSNQTRSRNIPEYLDQIGPETIRETVVDEVCDDLMRKYQGEFHSGVDVDGVDVTNWSCLPEETLQGPPVSEIRLLCHPRPYCLSERTGRRRESY